MHSVISRIIGAQISAQNSPLRHHAACISPTLPASPISRLLPADPSMPAAISALGFSRSPSHPLNSCPSP